MMISIVSELQVPFCRQNLQSFSLPLAPVLFAAVEGTLTIVEVAQDRQMQQQV